jgi:hypothetical protein
MSSRELATGGFAAWDAWDVAWAVEWAALRISVVVSVVGGVVGGAAAAGLEARTGAAAVLWM